MCGVFGIQNSPRAAQYTLLGLYALQHRGEESAGIAIYDGNKGYAVKGRGLVEDVFKDQKGDNLKGSLAIGHVRYSTTGSSNHVNVQPFMVNHRGTAMAVAHNGNLTNTGQLLQQLEQAGSIFQTSMDSEILIHLLAKAQTHNLKDMFMGALHRVEGAYSAIFMINDVMVGARDPYGVRPLSLGKLGDAYVLSSETCAFDLVGVTYIRDVQQGEIVFIYPDGRLESVFLEKKKRAACIFEEIYFARPDSSVFGDGIALQRRKLGAMLAKEAPCDADMVIAVPDSGNFAAMGYAQEAGIPFEMGIVRNHYIGRTFIQATQFMRDFRVKIKLNPIKEILSGKRIVLVDDSIVRGTTSRMRIETLKSCGVKEIHMRVSCPPVKNPCYYGMDFPTREELIGATQTVEQIRSFIGVDTLHYLSQEGMHKALRVPGVEDGTFCDACFSGTYPILSTEWSSKYVMEMRGKAHKAGGV